MTRRTRLSVEALDDRRLPSFGAPTSFPVGPSPQAVVTTDFNHDGHLDLATANAGDSTVSVLLGDGQGGFGAASNLTTGTGPSSPVVGDFDGDGNVDLVTTNQSLRYVSVLRGNGDGTFRPPVTTDTRSLLTDPPVAWWTPVVADFNSDGKSDLAFVTHYSYVFDADSFDGDHFEVILSNSQGGFGGHSTFGYGGSLSALAVADLNADGVPDVVEATNYYNQLGDFNYTGEINVYFGGQYQYPYPITIDPFPQNVMVGDFNGDDIPDILLADSFTGTLDVLPGDGHIGFSDFGFSSPISSSYSPVVGVADFNGDGNLDVDSGGSVRLGRGDGTFADSYSAPTSSTTGDFNGDSLPDVVAANAGSNTVSVRLNDGNWSDSPTPLLQIDDVTVTEGNAGSSSATFTLSLSTASSQTITVHYATADGTATAGSDYTAASGDLTFAPGQISKTISVAVRGDRLAEPTETFAVKLSSPTNATIADDQGIGTILDDEPRISITDVSRAEGKAGQTTLFTFTVTLSVAYDQAVTMSFRTVNGTAKTSDNDYVTKTGTLTFAPGQTTKTITIEVIGDNKREDNEVFYLDLFNNSSNSIFTKARGVGAIINDDLRRM